jgi:hypothetical protein
VVLAELKTKKTGKSVSEYLAGVKSEQQRKDCKVIAKLMKEVTKKSPKLWGSGMIGYGDLHYKGRSSEGDWFMVGYSPRATATTLYLSWDLAKEKALLKTLGPHKHGKGCLYLKSLDGIDLKVLKKLIQAGYKSAQKAHVPK